MARLTELESTFLGYVIQGEKFVKPTEPSKLTISVIRYLSKLIQDHHVQTLQNSATKWKRAPQKATFPETPSLDDMKKAGFKPPPTGKTAEEYNEKALGM